MFFQASSVIPHTCNAYDIIRCGYYIQEISKVEHSHFTVNLSIYIYIYMFRLVVEFVTPSFGSGNKNLSTDSAKFISFES